MLVFLNRFLAILGILFILILISVGYFIYTVITVTQTTLPERIVLVVDLREGLDDHADSDIISQTVLGSSLSLHTLMQALDRAATDERVVGLIARIGDDSIGIAQSEDVHQLISRFADGGRFTIAHATSFGEFGPGTIPYYLATGFEEIALQPQGLVSLTGILLESPFGREALDEWSIQPRLVKRGVYKTAPEVATETGYSEAAREMLTSILDNFARQLIGDIAERRQLAPVLVQELIDRAPIWDVDALDTGLVDRLAYFDEIEDDARERGGEGAEIVPVGAYLDAAGVGESDDTATTVALVYASGPIGQGDGSPRTPVSSATIGADAMVEAIEQAIDDEVDVLVLRITSGGGSVIASETIRRATQRARSAGINVVVSMGNVAASGGYWISADADSILANRGTLTGSIGVFAGKLVTEGFWANLGIRWDQIGFGANANMWSGSRPYSEAGRARVEALVDTMYDAFIGIVANGRDMPRDQVRQVAEGRVWTGTQAIDLGLIDRLGGLRDAIMVGTQAVGGNQPRLVVYPRSAGPLAELLAITEQAIPGIILKPLVQAIGQVILQGGKPGGPAEMHPIMVR
jgi:protease-4